MRNHHNTYLHAYPGRQRAKHEQHRTHHIGLTRHWLRRSESAASGEDAKMTSHATGCGRNEKIVYTSRFVRVILAQGPC